MSTITQKEALAIQNKQVAIREFDTHAPLAGGVTINPLKLQLIAHFDALTTEYAQRVAVDQLASLARLCTGCKKEK